jgi:membrane protein
MKPHSVRDRLLHWSQRLQRSLPAALIQRFIEIDVMAQAAALAFYALLSLAPLLVLLLWLTTSLYPSAQDALMRQVAELAGREAATIAETIVQNAKNRPSIGSIAGLWSTLLLFIGATAVFSQLQAALNMIFRTEVERLDGVGAWLRKRIFSFGVVLALGFLLLVSMTLNTALQIVFARVPSLLPALGNTASLGLYIVAFALLYHYLPDRRVVWRQAFLGALLTSALFVAGRWLIGLYIAQAAPGSAYGSMGTLVILLVWMYYATVVFFAGALLTAVIDERWQARRKRRHAASPPPPA